MQHPMLYAQTTHLTVQQHSLLMIVFHSYTKRVTSEQFNSGVKLTSLHLSPAKPRSEVKPQLWTKVMIMWWLVRPITFF